MKFLTLALSAWGLLLHFGAVRGIARKYLKRYDLGDLVHLATFYREYGRIFSRRMLREAEYVRHAFRASELPTDAERMASARRLVECYAQAALVVTSRIHCALPCLGLDVPVVLIENRRQDESGACRFAGLRELLHVVEWDGVRLRKRFAHDGRIGEGPLPRNKPGYRKYARELIARCEAFAAKK